MATERIPCGGWDIDTSTLQFQGKVLKAVGGIDGAYLPLTGGIMGPDAMIEGTDSLTVSIEGTNQSATAGVTPESVTLIHNSNGDPDASIRLTANAIELEADFTTVTVNGTGVNLNGANITGVGSITGYNSTEVTIETTLDMNNHNINNVAEPTQPEDAATKNYVDNNLLAYRLRDLFGVPSNDTQTIVLPVVRQNVAVIFYSVDSTGNANVSNSKAISVAAGAQEVSGDLTIDFNADGKTITLTNANDTDAILGQYYGYN